MIARLITCALALLLLALPAHAEKPDAAALRNEAYEAAQKAMTTSASKALAQLGARFAAGSDELAKSVRTRQDLTDTLRKLETDLLQVMSRKGGESASKREALRTKIQETSAKIAAIDEGLNARFPAYAELANPKPLSITATQQLLGPDEALALIFVGPEETFVWAISKTAVDWHRVDIRRKALIASTRELRAGLNPANPVVMRSALRDFGATTIEHAGTSAPSAPAFNRTTAHHLFSHLIKPLDGIIAPAKRLYIIGDTPFDSLPFAVLLTQAPTGENADPAALRASPWLIKRQALVTLPSVSSLQALRQAGATPGNQKPFRGFGAPTFKPDPTQQTLAQGDGNAKSVFLRGSANLEAIRNLAPLPQTAGELRQLASALNAAPDSIVLGAAATERAVRSEDLSKYRVLAFATHGLLAGDLDGLTEPALAFTPPEKASPEDDGLLTASEAAQLKLAADWVILSACNTAGGDGTPGADGLSGLARAFFYAGAKSLLVSHWPVRDDAAARLTTRTLSAQAKDTKLAKAEAYQRAVLELMADTSDPTLAHPAIWAPFVIVGEGR